MTPPLRFFTYLRNEAAALALILGVWAVAAIFYPPYIIPSPVAVFFGGLSFLPPDFWAHLAATLYRTGAGFGFAFLIGCGLGIVAFIKHWSPSLNALMLALQVLPGTILGVIFLLVFGIGDQTPIVLVALLTLPTIAINTTHGLDKKSLAHEQYLATIGGSKRHLLQYIYLPALIPTLQSNFSIGLGLAFKVVVLGEFIGSQNGIGYLLNTARIYFNMKAVFFYMVVLMLVSLVLQAAVTLICSTSLRKYFYPE